MDYSGNDKAKQATISFTQGAAREALALWVIGHVSEWERWRMQHFDTRWRDYWRKWRGIWSEDDRTRGSERSRLISPALQQAVEEAVAEIEEATVGEREAWFDLDDDNADTVREGWQAMRRQLLDDMAFSDVQGALVECALNGALYGTAVAKVVVETAKVSKLKTFIVPEKAAAVEGVQDEERVVVRLEPVRPDQFVIDTAVNRPGKDGIAQALGVAHRLNRPRHALLAKMNDETKDAKGRVIVPATYYDVPLEQGGPNGVTSPIVQDLIAPTSSDEDVNLVTEYHGLVPRALFDAAVRNDNEAPAEIDTRDMIEAIVTIIDDKWLARAVENENLKADRSWVAAPWDLVPGSFWGRGVAEKGYNSQQALDAMLRAQLDGVAYTVHPMLGVNAARRDPRAKIEVGPGKVLSSNGDPRETFYPLTFGNIDPTSFSLSGELERLIQSSTGTAGASAPIRTSRVNETVGGMSLVRGDLAKRHKRTLRLWERHLLQPLVEKFALRHMYYNEEVYPFLDIKFRVRTSMSLVAREVESQQLVSLLQTVPPGPVFYAILGKIIENSSMKDKEFVMQLIQATATGQIPGGETEREDPVEQQRKVIDAEEVVARTEQKRAQTAKIIQDLERGGRARR